MQKDIDDHAHLHIVTERKRWEEVGVCLGEEGRGEGGSGEGGANVGGRKTLVERECVCKCVYVRCERDCV